MSSQAKPKKTNFLSPAAFGFQEKTSVRWLGAGSAMINSRGTVVMIDPVMELDENGLLIRHPIRAENVPSLDAVLITHSDDDHFDLSTLHRIKNVRSFHSTQYVSKRMLNDGIPGLGHDIGDHFLIGSIDVELTPADHDWQNDLPQPDRHYEKEDCCGFYLRTPDGSIWMPGDSRLMEQQLHFPEPDVILMDFSDNEYHIGLDNAVRFSKAYPNADMILIHWGTMDAPDFSPFNGDPDAFLLRVHHPSRVRVLSPGEEYVLGQEFPE